MPFVYIVVLLDITSYKNVVEETRLSFKTLFIPQYLQTSPSDQELFQTIWLTDDVCKICLHSYVARYNFI